MQIHTEFRGIPEYFSAKNTAEFRMFFKKFRIPSEDKNALPWTPYLQLDCVTRVKSTLFVLKGTVSRDGYFFKVSKFFLSVLSVCALMVFKVF